MPDPANIWEEGGYPPSSFYFQVVFERSAGIADVSFQEVSGIGPELETQEVIEGGENTYVHQLPKVVKHPKLILKRGIAKKTSDLVEWCREVLEEFTLPIKPKAFQVRLLNEKGDPIRSWSFANAYPVHWEVESFHSTKSEVAIEKIEFRYSYSKRFI